MEEFFYPVSLYNSDNTPGGNVSVPWLEELPLLPNWTQSPLCVISSSEGNSVAGMYANFKGVWVLVMPYKDVCAAIINGGQLRFYMSPRVDVTFDPGTVLFRNGISWQSLTLTAGASLLWIVELLPVVGAAGVTSVNGKTGAVTLTYSDIPGAPNLITIPPVTAVADGQQILTLPSSISGTDYRLFINGLFVDQSAYTASGQQVTVPATLNVKSGDVLSFSYEG